MKNHLVDLYQVCSNYAPGVKMDCPGVSLTKVSDPGPMGPLGFFMVERQEVNNLESSFVVQELKCGINLALTEKT